MVKKRTFREMYHDQMLSYAQHSRVRFIGYNTKFGHKMYGTLIGCEDKCIEAPVAENLMVGIAMGYALTGFLPVLCFERMDFMLAAADALINEVAGLRRYGLEFPVLIRAVIGAKEPLDPGFQHTQDHTAMFEKYFLTWTNGIVNLCGIACPTLQIERRADYDKPID